jgi:beta-lactamase regulating signal transducer with metallopeptidase domain
MSIGWLLYVLVTGTLLALAASAAAAALARNGRPTRWVWSAAILGTVALAVIAPRKGAVEEPRVTRATVPAGVPVTRAASAPTRVDRMRDVRATLDAAAVLAVAELERRVPVATMRYALVAWAIVSSAMLAVFVLVSRKLVVARRRWPRRVLHGTSVRVAPTIGPAVIGVLRVEIVVPPSLLERSDEEQRLILAHEHEHVRANDHLLLGGAWLTAALLPWHPAVWWMANRLRLAIELDCDARVLQAGASPARYGRLLIDMAAWRGASRIGALALTDGISHLERRILAMRASRSRHATARGVALAAFGGLLVLVACEARIPTSAEIAQMDVAKAQRSVAEAGLLRTPSGDRTDFFINGVRASAEAARALEARQVGSITLVRSELPTGRDTMFVVTADRLSDEERRERSARQPDPLEAAAPELARKIAPDTERIVAHVERERANERMQTVSDLPAKMARRTPGPSAPDEAAIITIDGKLASEGQLAALEERDIASIAVYKGKEALLNLISNGKEHLEVTSDPAARTRVMQSNALIAVTTKMARAAHPKSP